VTQCLPSPYTQSAWERQLELEHSRQQEHDSKLEEVKNLLEQARSLSGALDPHECAQVWGEQMSLACDCCPDDWSEYPNQDE